MDKMQEYYKNSLLANLCSEYKNEWKAKIGDKEALFRFALSQQSIPHLFTFAYNGTGLTKEYIETEFSDYINGKYVAIDADGVKGNYKTSLYVGENTVFRPSDDVLAFMWATVPLLTLKATRAAKIYIGCKSKVNITLEGFNNITLMMFDESEVFINECDQTCNVTIYKYSKKANAELDKFCLANVKTHDKILKL